MTIVLAFLGRVYEPVVLKVGHLRRSPIAKDRRINGSRERNEGKNGVDIDIDEI